MTRSYLLSRRRRPGRPSRLAHRAFGLALVAVWLWTPCALVAQDLATSLERLVAETRRASPELGVHVVDLTTGEPIYGYRQDELRIPASNTKLFTSAAALDLLGPGYFFETRVALKGVVAGAVLRGDLGVVGGGDPNISGRHFDGDSLAVFRRWAAALGAEGVERIEGDVYLAHGMFEGPMVHPDWPRDQLDRWYEAPVSALSFNDNCVLVRVWPGSRSGGPARVETVPDLPLFEIQNRALTTSSVAKHRVIIGRGSEGEQLMVRGTVFSKAAPVESWVAVTNPLEYFALAMRKALREEGIRVTGRWLAATDLPDGPWRDVAVHRSDLLTTLEVVNKRSQNFYAESVVKTLGARLCDAGSWEGGVQAVGGFLERLGIETGSYQLADGSGMSRNNRFTARQITTLLQHMFLHPLGPEFITTLPHAGEEGLRWEKRLAEPPYRGNVFAKTGSLSGVSTLSGFVKAASGRVYAFSILCNKTRSNWQAKAAQDRIVRALVDQG